MDFVGWAFVAVIAAYAFGGALLDWWADRQEWDGSWVRLRAAMEQRPRPTGFWTPEKRP